MSGPIRFLLAMDTAADHHIEPIVEQPRDHLAHARRVIGRVAVDQHIDVGFDVREHPPHDIAFALAGLAEDVRAGRGAAAAVLSVELLS